MKQKHKDIIFFALIVSLVVIAVLCIDYMSRTGPFNEPNEPSEYINFTCYRHNYTERDMEPMTVYPIFLTQYGVCVIDGHGGGLIRMFHNCLESQAVVGNETIWCNETVEVCEDMYNNKERIL